MAKDEPPRGRRAPQERRRDAERTRRALLDAALHEFAEKGRAGARVSEIAARAGVNKQLISYYFGGKDGLYRALLDEWHAQEGEWATEGLALDELVLRYLHAGAGKPEMQQFFLRELLEGWTAAGELPEGMEHPDLADLRRRKAAGELADDVDPALALLLVQAATVGPTLFGADVRAMTGLEPDSPEFLERYGALLRRIVRGLAQP